MRVSQSIRSNEFDDVSRYIVGGAVLWHLMAVEQMLPSRNSRCRDRSDMSVLVCQREYVHLLLAELAIYCMRCSICLFPPVSASRLGTVKKLLVLGYLHLNIAFLTSPHMRYSPYVHGTCWRCLCRQILWYGGDHNHTQHACHRLCIGLLHYQNTQQFVCITST